MVLLARSIVVLNNLIFIILATNILISSFVMISTKRVIDSALSMLIALLSIAGVYATLQSSFMFITQIIIYAGAILSLVVFIIMFLNIKEKNLPNEPHKTRDMIISSFVVFPISAVLIYFIKISDFGNLDTKSTLNIDRVGFDLYMNYALAFELISVLLLISLIGSITLARKDKDV